MEQKEMIDLLRQVASGTMDVEQAALKLKEEPFEDLGFAKIDHHRAMRQGVAEVIYGEGKTPEQIFRIAEAMKEKGWNNVTLFKTVQALTENNFLEVKGLEKAVKTYARKLAPSMTRAEYYGNLLASRGITKEDLPQIIASVIGTEKDSVEKEIDEMLQRL